MEPLDSAKNDERKFSKRRISSILKAPQKSITFSDPEQQENVLECVKSGEKRNSRRVSFAPANNVLLFSKDGKNASPVHSPLQDLMTPTAAVTQNSVQVTHTEDGIQRITGMATLLNAPLHASQQRDKVNFETGGAFGETTVMFSTNDALMDMTHSQTINIASDAELLGDISLQNYDTLPASREKLVMFTADDGSMDMTQSHTAYTTSGSVFTATSKSVDFNAEMRNKVPSVPCVDPGIENFLTSLFKASGPSTGVTHNAGSSSAEANSSLIKTQKANVDKENRAPNSVSAMMDKSHTTSRKIDESSYGYALSSKDDDGMDMTEAQTGRIQGFTDGGDLFQFPTQKMYSQLDSRSSTSQTVEKTKPQKSSNTLASLNPTDMVPLKNPSLRSSHQRHKAAFDSKVECREKTIMFSAGDALMDMTQSHTVNIASGALAQRNQNRTIDNASSLEERKRESYDLPGSSANGLDLGFKNFLANLSKTTPSSGKAGPPTADFVNTSSSMSQLKTDAKENQSPNTTISCGKPFNGGTICLENDMDMTEVQTGRIVGFGDSDDPSQFLIPLHNIFPHCESLKRAKMTSRQPNTEELGSSNSTGMETSLMPTSKTKVQGHHYKFDAEDDAREKTVRFSADDACMDATQSHTVNIVTDFATQDVYPQSSHLRKAKMKSRQQGGEALGSSNLKGMVTSLTDSLKTKMHKHQVKFDSGDDGREKTVRFTADEAYMDVTRSHTVNIATDLDLQSHQNVGFIPDYGEKTVRFNANDAAMDVTRSLAVNIDTGFDPHFLPSSGEKTVRFSANDAAMDVTRSLTVKIATDLDLQSHRNVDLIPAFGEKTVRFSANEAAMDVTRSQTVNIATDLDLQSHRNVDLIPAFGEKTVRFSANDAAMNETRSQTVNIATDIDPQSRKNVDFLPACAEKTLRFNADEACMDVTKSHTVNIATDFDRQPHQNLDFTPACRETARSRAYDAPMDVTQRHIVNIASNSVLPDRDSTTLSFPKNTDFPLSVKRESGSSCAPRSRSSAHTLAQEFKNSLSKTSGLWANPVITKVQSSNEIVDTNDCLEEPKVQQPNVNTEMEFPGFASAVIENPVNKTMADEDDISMGMTEVQTGNMLEVEQTCTDEAPQCPSSSQGLYPNSDCLSKVEMTSQQSSGPLKPFDADPVEITKHSEDFVSETGVEKECGPRNQTNSPDAVDVDEEPSRKSRRLSLANLHSKIRRLSHMIKTSPDKLAMDSHTVPLPQLQHDEDKNSNDKAKSPAVTEPGLEKGSGNTEGTAQAECLWEVDEPSHATPFNLKTKQLMSRLSVVGGFKAKLPQRSKPDDPKKVNSVGDHTMTLNFQVGNQDADVSDIYNEELGSCEDMSEMLDTRSPQKATEKASPSQVFYADGPSDDDVFEEDLDSAVHGKKRHFPVDENNVEDEKRMKASPEAATDFGMTHLVECDGNITTAPCMTTQTTDDSNSNQTASLRYEATFESTFKQSLFESQLEDYANDMQRKFDDGTITVLEFLKLFNIDFVIHNPRQSVLPRLSDTEHTPMDLMKDRHINRPKQRVYETDVLKLTERVEGLKARMQDLDKPLRVVNRPLWDDMRNSSEMELKAFGAKLKERNNLFRKTSKVRSHEMKEVLYSNLVQANLEEQQRLRGTIQTADEMIKSLDDCICDLKTELAAVEEKGFEDSPSLKSQQEEMRKVTEALADKDRQISELELQSTQNSKKRNRLKAETRNLEGHVTTLQMLNEWKFGENRDSCTIFTFLHETLRLQLEYEKSNGIDADNQSERKISHITFTHELDVEMSRGYACLVHKLLSQYIEGEAAWVEKYPTSRHVPKLLHDVGLVVSRCRLLGEELRLLEMWGGLRLDILDVDCVDTRVHFVFSSLKKFSKFEVTFAVSLADRHCVFQVQRFKNVIGDATIQPIEEIVASFSPGKNLLTKIVKKIHEKLLC